MTLDVRSFDDAVVIWVESELDLPARSDLNRAILSMAMVKKDVIVSLERCDFCDLAGLQTLLVAKRWLKHRLNIVIPRDHVARRVLSILSWSSLLCPFDSLDELLR